MLDKRGYLQSIAIFMSCLIISLPIYSASVFAGLDNIAAKGSDGIDDYVRADDYVNFEVTASIEGDEIGKEQVFLGDTYEFDSCTAGFEGYECELKYPASGTYPWGSGAQPYTINLKDDAGSTVDSSSGTLYVDNLAPSVTSFSITQETSTGQVTLDYAVEDYAYSSGDTSKCTGIEKIEFREDSISGSLWKTLSLNIAACSKSDSVEYIYSGSDGPVTICAVAYDRFDQSSTNELCDTFTLDTTGPVILVDIVNSGGDSIYYLGAGSLSAFVKANITSAGLDTDSIKADLSSLGLGTEVPRDGIETIGDYTIATWNVLISAGTTAISIEVEASDAAENTATQTFTRTLGVDTTAPIVTSLQTDRVKDDESYAKATGNNFTATFTETESGLNPNDVKLYIGGSAISADNCESGTCYWYGKAVSGLGTVEVYIGTDTKDRAGNSVVEKFPITITVDNTKPIINSIKITSPITGYAATGDTITVIVNVSDDSPVHGYADLSEAISSIVDERVECTKEGNYFICEWEGIVDSGAGSAELEFKIYDIVDNYEEGDTTISISGAEAAVSDLYKLILSYIQPIEKQTLEQLVTTYYYQIVPFILKHEVEDGSLCSSIEIVNVKLTGSGCSTGSYVNYNKATDNKDYNGFFQFAITPSAASGDSITIGEDDSCYLEFKVVCDNTVYSTAEKESIYFNIPINVPISEAPDATLTETINEAKDRADSGLGQFIEILDQITVVLTNICRIKTIFGSIITVYILVGSTWSECISIPWTAVQCKAAELVVSDANTVTQATEEAIDPFLNKMCSLVTCTNKGDTSYTGDLKWQDFKLGAYCDVLREWIMSSVPTDVLAGLVGASMPSTLELSKKSWIFSIGCFCVPGMIYNLKKWQEIECWKAYCYQKMVPAGLPKEECDKQYSYSKCVYLHGQWTAILDILFTPFNMIMDYIANPIASAWTAGRFLLGKKCNVGTKACLDTGVCLSIWGGWCTFYNTMLILENLAQIAQFIETIDEMQWEPTMNFCDALD